jgi:MPBQ/MSBQ methyltransferase
MSEDDVQHHYHRDRLIDTIRDVLRKAGADPDHPTIDDLAALDELHIRGRPATEELAAKIRPEATDRVLDVGCGIGGPSRYLAATFGCEVTGVDLTASYVDAAQWLSRCVGLVDRVRYERADALALPFPDASFDLVWTQHAAMNIADKAKLYAEMQRVLVPGGRLALYDVTQGPGGPVIFPVPWAREPSLSHLVTPDELRSHLESAGFEIASMEERSAAAKAWYAAVGPKLTGPTPPPAALTVLIGPNVATVVGNLGRCIEEGRIVPVEVIARRR